MATAKKGLEALNASHNRDVKIPTKIAAALAAMAKEGADRWEYDGDFRTQVGLCPADLAAYRSKFAKHLVWMPPTNGKRDKKLIWCALPTFAKNAAASIPGATAYESE